MFCEIIKAIACPWCLVSLGVPDSMQRSLSWIICKLIADLRMQNGLFGRESAPFMNAAESCCRDEMLGTGFLIFAAANSLHVDMNRGRFEVCTIQQLVHCTCSWPVNPSLKAGTQKRFQIFKYVASMFQLVLHLMDKLQPSGMQLTSLWLPKTNSLCNHWAIWWFSGESTHTQSKQSC